MGFPAEKGLFLQKNAVGGGHRRKPQEGFRAQESRALANFHKKNGRFVVLTKLGGNSDIALYPQKQWILLIKPRKSTKMVKMAGVTPTK